MGNQTKQHIYMPNEIFTDLHKNIEKIQHVVFAYAYYYYVCYLYRYCLYEGVTQSDIKVKLTYDTQEKRLDYIIKKGGILDKIGYTQTTKDYPLSWSMDEYNQIQFQTISDMNFNSVEAKYIITDKNAKVKYPIKMFHRTSEDLADLHLNGTLYDISNTHDILFSVFDRCMTNKELGTTPFFIYSYIRHKNDLYGDYRIGSRNLSLEIGVSEPTLFKYLFLLEKYSLLAIDHKQYVGKGGEANLYKALV